MLVVVGDGTDGADLRDARLDGRVAVGSGEPLVGRLAPDVAAVEGEVDTGDAHACVGEEAVYRERAGPARGGRRARARLLVHELVGTDRQHIGP